MNSEKNKNDSQIRLTPTTVWNWSHRFKSNIGDYDYVELSQQPETNNSRSDSISSDRISTSSKSSSGSGQPKKCKNADRVNTNGNGNGNRPLLSPKARCIHFGIFMVAFVVLTYNVMECVWQCLEFSFLTGNEFFDDEIRAVLLMSSSHIPIFVVTVFVLSSIICFVAMLSSLHLANESESGRKFFFLYTTFSRFLTFFIIMSFFVHLWTYVNNFPDTRKIEDTKLLMKVEMFAGQQNSTPQWDETQSSSMVDRLEFVEGQVQPHVMDAFRKIAGAFAEHPICSPENAYPVGCTTKILDELRYASIKSLIDFGILAVFHTGLIWVLDYVATKTKSQRNNRWYMEPLPAAVAAAKPFVL